MTRVEINNKEVNTVVDLRFSKTFKSEQDKAKIDIIGIDEIKDIKSSDNVKIYLEGILSFIGVVSDKEQGLSKNSYTVTAKGNFEQTFGFDVNGRVFYELDSGKVIRKIINEKVEQKGTTLSYAGDSTSNVSGDAQIVLGDFRQLKINDRGKDVLVQYFRKDDKGEFTLNIDNVDYSGDEILELSLDMLINNKGGVFEFEIEYQTNGNNYVWDLGKINGIEKIKLDPANAVSDGSKVGTDNRLQVRTKIDGGLIEDRAFAIDYITVSSAKISDRDTDINTDIPNTGNIITRKFNDDAAESINRIITGENGRVILDGNEAELRKKSSENVDFVVDKTVDDVVDISLTNEYDNIRNKIEIQGRDDLAVKVSDAKALAKTGFKRIKQFFDRSITRQEDAIRVGKQYLKDRSDRNQKIEIKFADTNRFTDLSLGYDIVVNHPKSNITGDYRIEKIEYNTKESVITVEAVGSSI